MTTKTSPYSPGNRAMAFLRATTDCKLQIDHCKLQIELPNSSICNLHFAICNRPAATLGMLACCFALLPILALCGCGTYKSGPAPAATGAATAPATDAAGPTGKKGLVGVSVLTLTNPFFKVIGDNITSELAKAGYETQVVAGEFDVAKQ